jgi:hypothetical protein
VIIRYCLKCRVVSFLYNLSIGNFGQFTVCFSPTLQSNIGASLLTMHNSLNINLNKESDKRLSMDNIDIISIITGSLLGCGQAEKTNNGTRVSFFQEAKHVSYLL